MVEVIAQKSQNIKWETSVDGNKVSHRRIRRVSMDQFYALVTGEEDAFYQLCMALAVYMLGFHSYLGFANLFEEECTEDNLLKRLYEYAKLLEKKM